MWRQLRKCLFSRNIFELDILYILLFDKYLDNFRATFIVEPLFLCYFKAYLRVIKQLVIGRSSDTFNYNLVTL